jgi:hypothetical protein
MPLTGPHATPTDGSLMAKRYQLPKKILGVKIPKALRDLGWLQTFLESDIGRRILAEALVAAAAAASAALAGTQTETGAKAGKAVKKSARKGKHLVKDVVQSAAGAATEIIGNAAKSMLPDTDNNGSKSRRNTTH